MNNFKKNSPIKSKSHRTLDEREIRQKEITMLEKKLGYDGRPPASNDPEPSVVTSTASNYK